MLICSLRKYKRCDIMTYEVVIPVMIAFAISAILGPIVIPFLRKLKIGQTERKEL